MRDDMMAWAAALQTLDRSLQSSHQMDVERHARDFMEAEKLQSSFIGLQLEDPAKKLQSSFIGLPLEGRPTNEEKLRKTRQMLDLLVHAQACRTTGCQFLNCRRLKGVFAHVRKCTKRASGGCKLCQKVWNLLRFHAQACKESNCTIPRCKELKNILRISQPQAESRRRAAVNEMTKQRAVEAATFGQMDKWKPSNLERRE